MRRLVMTTMGLSLLALVGCGGEVEPQAEQAPATSPTEATATPLSPPEDAPAAATAEAPRIVTVDTEVPSAVHPIAGRSAFPGLGETIQQPMPATVLSDEGQFFDPVNEADIPDVVPWQEANRYVGYTITVQGRIVDLGQSRDGKVNFLNFHEDWRGKFYMVIFDDLAKTLDQGVVETFRGKTVRVKGKVEDHRGRPQIKILSMDQVRFVGE